MTGKRIEFPKKPISKSPDQFIDAWVSGNHKQEQQNLKLKRTTIFLPEELHKKLKIEEIKRAEFKSWCARHRYKMNEAFLEGFKLKIL